MDHLERPASLLDKVTRLEERVAALEAAASTALPPTAPASMPPGMMPPGMVRPGVNPAAAMPLPPVTSAMPPPPRAGDEIVGPGSVPGPIPNWKAQKAPTDVEGVLKWVGIGLVVLSAVFLLSSAISRGWIGPVAQLALATVGGLALAGGALHYRTSRKGWALAFAHGSVVTLAVCAAAAHSWLGIFSAMGAMVALAVAMAVGVALSLTIGRESVAATATAVGLAVPFNFLSDLGVLIASWDVAVVFMATTVAWARRWPGLRLAAALFGTAALFVSAYEVSISDMSGTGDQAIVQGAFVLVLALWWFGPLTLPMAEGWRSYDERLVALVPAVAFGSAIILWPGDEGGAGILAVALSVGFIALATAVKSVGSMSSRLYWAHVVGAGVLFPVALGYLTDGPAILLGLAGQAVGLGWLARKYEDELLAVNAAVVGVVAACWTAVGIFVAIVDGGFTFGQGLAYFVVLSIVGAIAVEWHRRSPDAASKAQYAFVGAWIGLMLWLTAALIPVSQGQVVVSIIWAAMGVGAILAGTQLRLLPLRTLGLFTLGVTIFKLVTVDLEAVDTIWRAGLFLVVGLALLRLGLSLPAIDARSTQQD